MKPTHKVTIYNKEFYATISATESALYINKVAFNKEQLEILGAKIEPLPLVIEYEHVRWDFTNNGIMVPYYKGRPLVDTRLMQKQGRLVFTEDK